MQQQRLYAVPPPLSLELPSSWLPRAALSQGETLSAVKQFLGFSHHRDADLSFINMELASVEAMCGLESGVFDEAHRVLKLTLSLKMRHPIFLSEGGAPRYRFCVECLANMRTPYFPLYWRFDAYRMCVLHKCLMEENCPHCGAMVCPLQDWATCGAHRGSHTFASQCLECSKFLWDVAPIKIDAIPERFFTKHERTRLSNGCGFVGALLSGKAKIQHSDETDIRILLPHLESLGMLASGRKSRTNYLRQKVSAKRLRSVQTDNF